MRNSAILVIALILVGCTYVDGTMKQVSGAPIDYSALDHLVEGQSTKDQALTVMGPPSRATVDAAGTESLEYLSISRPMKNATSDVVRYMHRGD